MTYRLDVPCKNCPDRVVGCHAVCERYFDFKASKVEPSVKDKASGDYIAMQAKRKDKWDKVKEKMRRAKRRHD